MSPGQGEAGRARGEVRKSMSSPPFTGRVTRHVSVSLHGEPRCLHLQNGANITCVEDRENAARLATWKVFKNIKLYPDTCCNMAEP